MGKTSKKEAAEARNIKNEELLELGEVVLDGNKEKRKIQLLSIIGEIEGHEIINNSKTTKYDHILPKLAEFEDDDEMQGLLVLLQTCGGDVESGLAIAEMIASLSKPTVSLVLGGSHSIGVPIATSAQYSFIVPSGTMVVHPVRMNGLFIGAPQTFDYFKLIQDRIVSFVTSHSKVSKERLEDMMMNTGLFTKDLGTILVGVEAVNEGIINEVGGLKEAMNMLNKMINKKNKKN
ncbi:MAG: ATP-dependent Clp protease proteolytic subunit [Lachnospiraceae bacterium]|nr:ATP-dependent Clp protease proteolytic subunit [Lachnospiraceae bacterium]MEE0862124.1 ATP-dependent Clp protease proteolytic subunit [Lachnospiraceae bacterium]